MWLWPYGYDYNALPDNWQEVKKLAEDAADALYQVHGTVFDPINSADLCKLFTVRVKVFPGSRNLAPDSCVVIESRLTLLL